MDHQPHSSDSEFDSQRPPKRFRRSPLESNAYPSSSNGKDHRFTPDQNPSPHSIDLPPLALSILGVEPLDEFVREIADFVHHMICTRPDSPGQVEVEAKIGVLRDKASGNRIQLPILVETILAPDVLDSRFESNMTPMQHKHYNTLLNGLKLNPPASTITPIEYTHLRLIDNFYATDNPRDKDKIRVTRDEKTGTVHACMRKVRLGSLDICSPKRAVDWRISVNMEIPVPPPIGTPTHTRRKDRMSYSHEECIIDLTQVTSTAGPNSKPEVFHELEVELARPDYLLSTAAKRGDENVSEHERNAFDELIRTLVNNARILVKNAGDGMP